MPTRYAEIARSLSRDIANGTYPVGSILPSEPILAEQLGISRSTLRAALKELEGSGMVSRRRSRGTCVLADKPVSASGGFSQNLATIDNLIQYAASTSRTILAVDDMVVDEELAKKLGVRPGSKWLKISHVRFDPETPQALPICWTDVYVPERHSRHVREHLPDHPNAISQLVEQAAGRTIHEIEQVLSATGIPQQQATALRAQEGGYALEIVRKYYFMARELAEVSVSIHPADRFAYKVQLSRR
ncbi:GntR family transcriptional regulator [Sphingobium sp. BHU LFT2]|uniref:GntR family transcriptional regulator n=1 Tax=Sphingobium sp. BHU LFT2 TaxID=2807634 RepID=UPI001BE59ED6|nr:GntR family transcriptional regulator [Sphingobium sp. BHU LFT2]MBT2245625.1 GntR family transcriptional regulator [Sphingobium sp. BHU LFT2]